ncbi:hypothetical protein [Granulicella arctica]|uniref:hypothetical protein n=1 Tax=Granulicella arctica TaxID=940613 RepID=UPI0021DFFCFC|nr:hypothetical protein [Granulicella arctica]
MTPANPARLRKIVVLYALLMILCGIGYAKYDNYQLDGDAVSFMDIADAIHTHNWPVAINGYWNPAYAATLAVGQIVAHPSRWNELQTYFWVNFFIFVACIGASLYLVLSLLRVREKFVTDADSLPAFSQPALLLVSLGLLFLGFQRELAIGAVRADALLLFFFFIAAAFLLRLQSTGRFIYYPLLGLALGLAYLTKSFAFLPSGILLAALFVFGITRKGQRRTRIVSGILLAGVVFACIAGPYILAISKQRGRFTTGESARLNYAYFVDETGRWHEWHTGDLGHAKADFKHHEELIVNAPPVYSFARHPVGTYPLWFDPSYWTDTIKPQVYLHGHILRLKRTTVLLLRYLVGHLESFVILGTLLLLGCFIGRRRASWLPLAPVALWGLLMLGIYFPIDLQDRYLTPAFLFVAIPVLAMLRRPKNGYQGEIATGMALLFAGLVFATAASDLGDRRRTESVTGYPRGAYSKQIYPAAKGITGLGITPGSDIACFGDVACYVDHYWARIAGTPIRAEIEVPDGSDPGAFWKHVADKQAVVDALRARNIKAIVGSFETSEQVPEGWHQLGASNFYAYPL